MEMQRLLWRLAQLSWSSLVRVEPWIVFAGEMLDEAVAA
jgi:hypothetical protein